jgi:hypothetical protein
MGFGSGFTTNEDLQVVASSKIEELFMAFLGQLSAH